MTSFQKTMFCAVIALNIAITSNNAAIVLSWDPIPDLAASAEIYEPFPGSFQNDSKTGDGSSSFHDSIALNSTTEQGFANVSVEGSASYSANAFLTSYNMTATWESNPSEGRLLSQFTAQLKVESDTDFVLSWNTIGDAVLYSEIAPFSFSGTGSVLVSAGTYRIWDAVYFLTPILASASGSYAYAGSTSVTFVPVPEVSPFFMVIFASIFPTAFMLKKSYRIYPSNEACGSGSNT